MGDTYVTDTGTGIDTSGVSVSQNPIVSYPVAQGAFNQLPIINPALSTETADIASETAQYGGVAYGVATPAPTANASTMVILAAVLGGLVLISGKH